MRRRIRAPALLAAASVLSSSCGASASPLAEAIESSIIAPPPDGSLGDAAVEAAVGTDGGHELRRVRAQAVLPPLKGGEAPRQRIRDLARRGANAKAKAERAAEGTDDSREGDGGAKEAKKKRNSGELSGGAAQVAKGGNKRGANARAKEARKRKNGEVSEGDELVRRDGGGKAGNRPGVNKKAGGGPAELAERTTKNRFLV